MTPRPHVDRFAELTPAQNPHHFDDERKQVLWVLGAVRTDANLHYMTPTEISDVLREHAGIDISRQKVSAILEAESGTVTKRRIRNRKHFKLMMAGTKVLEAAAVTSTFVDPEKALSEIRRVENTLANLRGDLKVCDPYVDNKTLDFLSECDSRSEMMLLTVNVQKSTRFRRDLAAFRKEHGDRLVVRVASQATLHDRYIVHQDGLLILGTSLNGFGKKQSIVVNVGEDLRAAAEASFDKQWDIASTF